MGGDKGRVAHRAVGGLSMETKERKERERKLLRVFRRQLEDMLRRIVALRSTKEDVYEILLKSLRERLERYAH